MAQDDATPPPTVLYFAANPLKDKPLELDEEWRLIHEGVKHSQYHQQIRLHAAWAARPDDMLQAKHCTKVMNVAHLQVGCHREHRLWVGA